MFGIGRTARQFNGCEGETATFLIKSIYTPEYSIMCDECKKDFFENIAFQIVAEDYRAYLYSKELNERFAAELKEHLENMH